MQRTTVGRWLAMTDNSLNPNLYFFDNLKGSPTGLPSDRRETPVLFRQNWGFVRILARI